MGMYTELNIGVEFKKQTPKEIIEAINTMTDVENEDTAECNIDHPLFKTTERWRWMLRSGGSYYFSYQPTLVWRFDDISKTHFLSFCTNIKNYSGEWEKFLDFIAPHVEEGYIGTYRYEEDRKPTLVFIQDGKVVMENVV